MRDLSKPPFRIACLAPPEVQTSALFGGFDILSTARGAPDANGVLPEPGLRPFIVTHDGNPVTGWNGRTVVPDCSVADAGRVDAIYIPAVGELRQAPAPQPDAVLDWVRDSLESGATLAAACSGACVLAEAGVLHGERATTHWAWTEEFKRLYPDVVVQDRRAMVFSGPEHRIVTAGGGSLWADLMLFLVFRFLGQEAALASAKFNLIDWGRNDQLAYSRLEASRQHYDAQISTAQKVIAERLTEENAIEVARSAAGMPERTFDRRFKAATGLPPGRYIQNMRVERAKHLLETSNVATEALAEEVGYADPASFRRLFIRLVGTTPSEYRRRFGVRFAQVPDERRLGD